jgi:hypothetical protein
MVGRFAGARKAPRLNTEKPNTLRTERGHPGFTEASMGAQLMATRMPRNRRSSIACTRFSMPSRSTVFPRSRIRAVGRGRRRVPVPGGGRASRESCRGADHQSAVFRMDPGHPQRSTLQSAAGSNHRSRSHSGDRHGILPPPPNCGQAEEGSQDALTAGHPWKCRSVESLENQTPVFHPSTALGNRCAIPAFPALRRLVPIYR